MARRPRLLILTPDYPPAPGGIQVVSERLAAGLEGFETRVLALDMPGAAQFDRERSVATRRVRGTRLPRGARLALLNAVAVREALLFRPDATLSMHLVLSPAAAAVKRILGVPSAQYFHAEEIGARRRLAAFAAAQADVAIAVSRYTASLVRDVAGGRASIDIVPNGVDLPPDAAPAPADRPTVLTIARIQERYKGHDMLVRALPLVRAKIPQVQWVVIGDGSLRAGVEQLARSYAVTDSIRFLGTVSDERRNSWLRRAHLLAMPSRLPAGGLAGEGFGIVYTEAAAYGKPVVAGNVGGAIDAVLDGITGLLVDPLDPLAIAQAITTLLLDPQMAHRLGAAGRERARELEWPIIARRVQALLLELLATRASRPR